MPEPGSDTSEGAVPEPAERAGDSLRAAVERTLAATAAPAAETRQRAQELLDEVVRRGRSAREQATRRGEAAREEVVRRGEQAGERIADVISELRPAEPEALASIAARMEALERRLEGLEGLLRADRAGAPAPETQTEARTAKSNPRVKPEGRPSQPSSGAG